MILGTGVTGVTMSIVRRLVVATQRVQIVRRWTGETGRGCDEKISDVLIKLRVGVSPRTYAEIKKNLFIQRNLC